MSSRERFEITFNVTSYEVDFTGKMSVFALFNRFQDLAGNHAEFLKVGYDLLRETNLAWILSRIKVQIFSLPKWEEKVTLATWPKGIDRLFAMRDFELSNEKGEPLALATSCWLLVDIEKNKPRRPESLPIDLLFPGAPHAIKEVPDKLQLPDNLVSVYERPVWISDIDTNQHVNNAQYAKWTCDCFSENQFRTHKITSLQINFMEEIKSGSTIELLKSPESEFADGYYVAGKNIANGSVNFQASITWA